MIWFFAAICLVLLAAIRPARWNSFHEDYISPANCTPVKGLFTMLIVPSHFVGYLAAKGVWDVPYMTARSWLGQTVVCMFLFYSGYGIMLSIQRKGVAYVKSMPVKRMLTVLADMILAVLLFLLLRVYLGRTQTLERVLLSFVGWEGLGNSNWYIHVILVCYIASWLAGLILSGKRPWLMVLMNTVLIVGYALFMKQMGKDDYWYNTMLIYPLGMAFALIQPGLKKLSRPNLWWWLALAVSFAALLMLKPLRQKELVIYWLWTIAFTVFFLLLTMKLRLKSSILDFFGRHVFSIYMLQRLPMILLDSMGFIKIHPYLCLLGCFAVTCVMAVGFDWATGELHKLWIREK